MDASVQGSECGEEDRGCDVRAAHAVRLLPGDRCLFVVLGEAGLRWNLLVQSFGNLRAGRRVL